jgi:hypothetical protein
LRYAISKENVPAYVIFSDALRQMETIRQAMTNSPQLTA